MCGSDLSSFTVHFWAIVAMFEFWYSLFSFSSQQSGGSSILSLSFFMLSNPFVSCFFHFVLRFWNQIFTCCSVTHSSLKLMIYFCSISYHNTEPTCSGAIFHLHWGISLSRTSSPWQRSVSRWRLSASSCPGAPGGWPRSLGTAARRSGVSASGGRPRSWPHCPLEPLCLSRAGGCPQWSVEWTCDLCDTARAVSAYLSPWCLYSRGCYVSWRSVITLTEC